MSNIQEPSGNALPPMPPLERSFPTEAAPADTADATYKPLSLWALLGFGVALLYSVVMIVLAVSALVNGKPAIISPFTLLIPLLAIVICGLGRIQIALSENTLAGRSLTNWGIGLAVIVGLTYAAYDLAVYLALRKQAADFAEEWLNELKNEETTKAALKVMPPGQTTDLSPDEAPETLEPVIETRIRNTDKSAPRQFMRYFRQHELVRLLGETGRDTKIEFSGVQDFKAEGDAYEVVLIFRVTTPDGSSFDVLVQVRGVEAENNEYRGRRWHVMLRGSGTPREPQTPPVFSEETQKNGALVQSASFFANNWARKLAEVRPGEAMLDLLPPAERKAGYEAWLKESQAGAAAGSGTMVALPTGAASAALDGPNPLQKVEALTANFLVTKGPLFGNENEGSGAAAKKARDALKSLGRDDMVRWEVERVPPRRVLVKGTNRVQYLFDARVTVQGKETLTGVLVVEGDTSALGKAEGKKAGTKPGVEWQLVRFELQGAEPVDTSGMPAPPGR